MNEFEVETSLAERCGQTPQKVCENRLASPTGEIKCGKVEIGGRKGAARHRRANVRKDDSVAVKSHD